MYSAASFRVISFFGAASSDRRRSANQAGSNVSSSQLPHGGHPGEELVFLFDCATADSMNAATDLVHLQALCLGQLSAKDVLARHDVRRGDVEDLVAVH